MDMSAPLIFVTLFLIACFSLFVVYTCSFKEQSYEDALAEQRQLTNVLFGTKAKPKEKKNKKATKKSKEKSHQQKSEIDEAEHMENVDVENSSLNKLHVEFKEEPEEVPIKEIGEVKLKRVKKVRPILVKKDKLPEKVILDIIETPTANHFEENPPKDEFELLRSNSRDEILKQEPIKEKVVKEKRQTTEAAPQTKNKKLTKQTVANSTVAEVAPVVVEKTVEEKIVEPVAVLPQTNGIVGNPGKEKKKKKSEFNTRQQLTAEKDGLLNSVRKAELSKTEVQYLIDLLLNKQLEAPAVIDDWSEGKSDPVQKLKKQLGEKEKALAEEQQALVGVQAKLKEVRAEQQAERAQLQQKIRGLEEAIQAKQIELQASNNRTQVNTQNLQQLEVQVNAEILKVHKLMEENAELLMQVQEPEVRISQYQETDMLLAKLRADIDELSAQNQQLRLELQQSMTEKDHQQQHFLMQMGTMEKGLKQQIQQLEESHQELERNLEIAIRQENDWKLEISKLNTALQQQFEEKRRLEHSLEQMRGEVALTHNDKVDSAKLIAQLRSEVQQLKEEQISQVNGSSKENKTNEIEILNLTNELASIRKELSTVKTEAQQIEKRYKAELETSISKYVKIETELEEQKKKNNELRTKNWKVMNALNAAESRCISNKQPDIDLDKLTNEIRTKEQDSHKQFIQRLFPDIEGLQSVTSGDWQAEYGEQIKNYVNNLKRQPKTPQTKTSPEKSQEIAKLQTQLQHYKNIIDDTEGMLNKLQLHIEREEINWRDQLAAKEVELESLRENRLTPLQTRVMNLEQQLSQEIGEKQRISQECQLMKSHKPSSKTPHDATATIEKLSEEVNRLREQLRMEQTKNGDVNICLKAQNNSANGPAFIEHCLSSSSSLASSVIEEYNKKPKSKKKKKKDSKN